MPKLDPVIRKEVTRVALGTLVLSVVMELVFVLLKRWDYTVLLGNLLGAFAAVLNFFLMCITVTSCLSLEKDKAALKLRSSQFGRLLLMGAFLALAALLPCFNLIAAALPLLFPSIVIIFLRLTGKTGAAPSDANGGENGEAK